MRILGFTGYAGAGKTTAANALVERYGWRKIAFADSLREFAADLFVVQTSIFTAPDYKDAPTAIFNGHTPREVLQALGTDFARRFDPDVWVRKWLNRVEGLPKDTNVVVDDVRFPNEVAALRRLGGRLVRIERYDPFTPLERHESERYIATFVSDAIIRNEGSIAELQDRAVRLSYPAVFSVPDAPRT